MTIKRYIYLCCALFLFAGCEELIDIDLNDADPRIVIEANLSDLGSVQRIRVSRTVAFDEPVNAEGVTDAVLQVSDDRGRVFSFRHEGEGYYVARDFVPESGQNYALRAAVAGEIYESTCYMPDYVDVDSTGIVKEQVFGESFYFATFKFNDPADVSNYYKYDISINDAPSRFASVFSDKFNNGLYVTHQVADRDLDLEPGDNIMVRRYCVDEKVFNYWNEYQSTNPGSAAPGNPTSNISNNALGYFSVASAQEFFMEIMEVDLNLEENDVLSAP